MRAWVAQIEALLRIGSDLPAERVMRLRAVWVVGCMFLGTQVLNMIVMSASYGRLTYDHAIAAFACLVVLATVIAVRWTKQVEVFAAIYSLLLFAGTLGSALPQGTGINTALIPFLTIGPVINAYMAGRRATLIYSALAAVLLGYLFWVSISGPPQSIEGTHTRDVNRLAQAAFGLSLSTALSILVSEQVYAALADQRRHAERAMRAEAAKSDFLATMSHELRTPLNGVIGLTDALLQGDLTPHQRSLAGNIRSSGEGLLVILNDILDLSKIEAGKFSIDPQPTDVVALVQGVVAGWQETARAKGITLVAALPPPLAQLVMVDDVRLRQILQNLISNAIKFTAAGQVEVTLRATPVTAQQIDLAMQVIDTGKGIAPAMQPLIFEPFEQGERGTTRQFGGTGLGLSICRRLAEQMGGEVRLERSDASGTVFSVNLRVETAVRGPASLAVSALTDARALRGLRVLVAEDNEINRLVIGEYLRFFGARTEFVVDGAQCLARAQEAVFDVVLMDKHMPGMSGVEAVRALRRLGGVYAQLPVIAVTADAMTGEREELLAAGMTDFLAKPLRAAALQAALLRHVRVADAA